MTHNKGNYRSIMKATSIFGGVQVFNILITLIRGKAVALLIGTAGMGLNGLLLSGLKLVQTLTSLGISESAVRDMSIAFGSGDETKLATTYTVFRRWIWFTAILGAVSSILFAPLLSRFAFGNDQYTSAFVWLSSTFIFGALSGGIYTVLRATRKISYLAQANIYGSIAGLLVTLPILYIWRLDGVLPSIIAAAAASYLISVYFRKKVNLEVVHLSLSETFKIGKPMAIMGLNLSMSALLGAASAFVVNAYISNSGSLSDLGLYSAGMSIMGGYVGMVFNAIGTDYFPRLSAVIHNEIEWRSIVNQQAELVLIILAIVLVFLVLTAPILIRILLSQEFLAARNFIIISALAIPIKGFVWVLGFIFLAQGDSKLFFMTELIANVYTLGLNVLFYFYFGLDGLGISMCIGYSISIILVGYIIYRKYGFIFNKQAFILLLAGLLPLACMILTYYTLDGTFRLIILFLIAAATLSYHFIELNKRLHIRDILHGYFKK